MSNQTYLLILPFFQIKVLMNFQSNLNYRQARETSDQI